MFVSEVYRDSATTTNAPDADANHQPYGDGVPLQISTDQEGGVVNRIGTPLAVSPGNTAIGATVSPSVAHDTAAVSGSELRAMGINVDDAPVADVNTNPANSADRPRSFGDNRRSSPPWPRPPSPATRELVSDAEVTEIEYTAFTSQKKAEQITARLIVHRSAA